jgi:diguanylate cyclase (GGDEF)-like protein
VALPLIATKNVIGVVEFYASKPGFFNQKEIGLLKDLAADLSFALQYINNEEKINYLAYYDNLTGLPNRALFCDRVNQLLHAARDAKIRSGMIVLDVERFNTINDTFGRHAGDALVKQVTRRLTGKVKTADWLASVTRSSFAAYLPSIKDDAEIAHLLEDVMREIADAPFLVEGEEMRVTLKCGVSIYPLDGKDAEKLLSNAETALQRAKSSADRYLFFTAQMNARMAEKLTLENRLQRAIQNDEFVLYYQPIIDAHTKRITRLEGLLRWNHPDKGLIYPGAFIPILEESGLILDVGNWVLKRAASDFQRWASRSAHPPRVSVNISPLQLKQKGFAVSVAEAAVQCRAGAGALDLEITESVLMEEVEQNIEKLQKLKELGVDIVIDDFGTGYSSLSYLAKLPVSALKIDRSFIFDLEKNPKNLSIVTAIISLARSLTLKVIAEGVETEQQLQLLQLLKCDEIQGYLFSPAVPPADIEKFLAD